MIFRRPFADVIKRQLELFEVDHADLIRACQETEERYDSSDREDAEEVYGDYLDLVSLGTEALAELRDTYARTLDEARAASYVAAFNKSVARRLPRFALELEDT